MRNKSKISPKDIYKSLWRCRDFELSHLWQRSIFLSAFLVICFTSYGIIILEICKLYRENDSSIGFYILNLVGSSITILGYSFSILWIMMGKGSKAWYEKYEIAIYNIERNKKYSQNIVIENMEEDKVMHGCLPPPNCINDNLFSTDAGKYSVSRINIIIGQIFMSIWFILYLITVIFFSFSSQIKNITGVKSLIPSGLILALFILLIFYIHKCLKGKKTIKSSGI